MLCVSIGKTTFCTTLPSRQHAKWTLILCFFVQKGEHSVRGPVETGVKWYFGSFTAWVYSKD